LVEGDLGFLATFVFVAFISSCGFGFIRRSAPVSCFVPEFIVSLFTESRMTDTIRSNPTDPHKDLQLARAAAIEAYSDLEQQLCLQFADLMGASFAKASLVFYRITNSHSRNRIIQSLLFNEYGDRYKKFWGSLLKLIRQLDQERNQIVHWHIIPAQQELIEGEEQDEYDLQPFLAPHGDSDEVCMLASDLWEFVNKTEHVRLQATMFYIFHLGRPSPEDQQANNTYEAFLLPVTYPPTADYPGFHVRRAGDIPPQSSEE
jgi:hypothetical protein